ncbi:branched-chain amino acid transport system substrate-binding protein [Thermanaeromonas toyohensis ToBE]|uniref:Branched-chain amino acid transport system substrate-binding protein n=1 Tax=Thermanaeromonas toyohensis ToBE TaxID=698762 RepID=A0A1W1VGB3_9FIRM|nr:ABC transporter substrate-binding protein [Thermanaeromonas toyohensis]SMB92263.1 branched-chain amino acid transport system substrate-binding protein [Thermanaeromonas toyohensis ToBE]
MKARQWKVVTILGLLMLILLLSVGCGKKEGTTIKIGQIITSLTGEAAMYGHYQKNAAQMAADEINAAGGVNGKKIEIIALDDQAKPNVALNAMQKLISEVKPVAVLGPDWSGNTLAAAPVAQQNRVPQITSSKSWKITHQGNPYIFRVVALGPFVAEALVNYAYQQGYRKMAILYTNSEYGVSGGEGAKAALEKLGLKPVAYETYNVGDNDFTAQLMRIKNSGAEVVIDYSIQIEGAKSFRQMREMGINIPVYGGDAFITPEFAELVGPEKMEGIIAGSAFIPSCPEPAVQEFVRKYKEKYGVIPDDHAAPYYDAVKILAQVIAKVGTDREKIAEELRNLKGFQGVQGDYTADKWGNLIHSVMLARYTNGQWQYLTTIKNLTDHE